MGNKESGRAKQLRPAPPSLGEQYLICELSDLQVVGLGLQGLEQCCLLLQPGPQLPTEAMEAPQGYCLLQVRPVVLRRGRPRDCGEGQLPMGPSEWSCHPNSPLVGTKPSVRGLWKGADKSSASGQGPWQSVPF